VQIITRDGDPWFVMPELCRVLNLTNAAMVAESPDDDEKSISNTDILGGQHGVIVVSESGLYASPFARSLQPSAILHV